LEGRRCKQRFYPGEPILEAKLLAPGEKGQSPTDLIPKGYRVVSIRVDAVSSSSGMILPGDRVDLLVHVQENPSKGISQARTQTFLQNVKVFAVDDLYSRENEGAVSAKTISLLVTPDQAELVMLAGNLGTLQLVMRSANDDSNEPTTGADVQELLSGTENGSAATASAAPLTSKEDLLSLLNQAKEKEPVAPPPPVLTAAPAPTPDQFEMLVIKGPHAETMQFTDVRRPPTSTSGPNLSPTGDEFAPATDSTPSADGEQPSNDADAPAADEPSTDEEPSSGEEKTDAGTGGTS
jgi:Flp pilus assembly protein CpaB